jgi:hypothetical protein
VDLIGLITGKKDITRDWKRSPGLMVAYDFDRHALCGVRLGASLDDLQKLGPSENRRVAKNGYLNYAGRGFEVGIEEERFGWIGLVFEPLFYWGNHQPDGNPFTGPCVIDGRPRQFSCATTESEIVEAFGPPASRDAEPDDIVLGYSRGGYDYEIELTGQGKLYFIAGWERKSTGW